ncbi:hypothetical protein CQW23_16839 [Capsicum baccatum]|uniref:Uncharacterized protein n=1 Tax=Capsicum baccatum TaxID=33114 RepID=A0A2G2WC36_CAPBA|nr:hypothetical protein CQW23_16839 [Capsicum baccatum]
MASRLRNVITLVGKFLRTKSNLEKIKSVFAKKITKKDEDDDFYNDEDFKIIGLREFVLVSGDFMGEWLETPKCWKWRSFRKVTIPVVVRRNSSYDELVASVMQSGNLDCSPRDILFSYLINSREKVNPTIINSDVRVRIYMMDVDKDGFSPILRINIAERSVEGLVNSSEPPPPCRAVDNDFSDYENDEDQPINTEDDPMHIEEVSSDSQDNEEDHRTGSQSGHSFNNEANFHLDQTFSDKKNATRRSGSEAVL